MNKPRLRLYRGGVTPRLKYEVRGEVKCEVMGYIVFGYGYGWTMEQAYFNWLKSPIPF